MFRSMCCLMLVMVLASCMAPHKTSVVPGDFVAEAPKYKVGDRWKYNVKSKGDVYEKEVVKVEENGDVTIKITHNDMAALYVKYDREQNILGQRGTPPKLAYWKTHEFTDFPLFVGKTYSRTIQTYGTRGFNPIDCFFDFNVSDLVRKKVFDTEVHVFIIDFKYTVRTYNGPKTFTGKVGYSPELKALLRGIKGVEMFAYQVIADPLQKVLADGSLQPQIGHGGSPEGILTFGYQGQPGNDAVLAQMREELAAERERLAQEKRDAATLRAQQLADVEALKAKKLAEAERLAQAKLAAVEAEAERKSQALLAAAEAKARKLIEEQQALSRQEQGLLDAERQAKQNADHKKAEELAQLRREIAAERERLALEKSRAEALTAQQLAEARELRARTLAEAEQLAKETVAAAAAEAEKKSQALLAAAEEQARKLVAQHQATLRHERGRQEAEAKAKQLAAKKKLAGDNRYGIAVIIGNRNYSTHNPDVPDVDYAHNDAEAMYRYVKDTLGYKEGNIIYVKDATQAALTSVFGNERTHRGKLFNWTQAGKSKVFVYYSGHGAPGLSDGSGYLLPVNADPAAVELNGYPLSTLYQNLAKVPAQQVTVVLDACFSGSSASGNLVKNASSISLQRVKNEAVLKKGAVLTAAAVSEVASWDRQRKLGLFTAQYLEGVAGAADRDEFGDGNGQVSLGELKKYLAEKVSYQARRHYYRDQHPQVSGDDGLVLGYLNREM